MLALQLSLHLPCSPEAEHVTCAVLFPGLVTCTWMCRADDDAAMVLMHMLASGGVPETGALGAALVDAGAALLVCSAELALAQCTWSQDATCRTLCSAVLRQVRPPYRLILAPCSVHGRAVAAQMHVGQFQPCHLCAVPGQQ